MEQTIVERIVDAAYDRLVAYGNANPGWDGTILDVPGLNGQAQAAIVLAGAVGQIANGGLFQYVDNGIAHRTRKGASVPACVAAGALVQAGRDKDPEVADRLLLLLRGAATARHREDFGRLNRAIDANGLDNATHAMFALGHDRVDAFVAGVVATHPPRVDPFATAWKPAPLPPFAPTGPVRHPDVTVDLTGVSSNALALVGAVSTALRKAGVPREEIEDFRREALSGNYDKVLATLTSWVSVELGSVDEEMDEELVEDMDLDEAPAPGMR